MAARLARLPPWRALTWRFTGSDRRRSTLWWTKDCSSARLGPVGERGMGEDRRFRCPNWQQDPQPLVRAKGGRGSRNGRSRARATAGATSVSQVGSRQRPSPQIRENQGQAHHSLAVPWGRGGRLVFARAACPRARKLAGQHIACGLGKPARRRRSPATGHDRKAEPTRPLGRRCRAAPLLRGRRLHRGRWRLG